VSGGGGGGEGGAYLLINVDLLCFNIKTTAF